MKDLKKVLALGMIALFTCYSGFAQDDEETLEDPITVIGTYDGFDDDMYSFIISNGDDDEESLFFDYVNDDVLAAFDLQSQKLVGKKFQVTYTETIEIEEDEDGEEVEYTKRTIISLKPVK